MMVKANMMIFIDSGLATFGLITNRMANSTSSSQARHMTTRLRTMRHVHPVHDWRNMPIAILLVIVFVASVSTAVIYPSMFRSQCIAPDITDLSSVRACVKSSCFAV